MDMGGHREGVLIGYVDRPDLAGLTEGETVLLREIPDVQIEGRVYQVQLHGQQIWFAEFTGASFEDIPESELPPLEEDE